MTGSVLSLSLSLNLKLGLYPELLSLLDLGVDNYYSNTYKLKTKTYNRHTNHKHNSSLVTMVTSKLRRRRI